MQLTKLTCIAHKFPVIPKQLQTISKKTSDKKKKSGKKSEGRVLHPSKAWEKRLLKRREERKEAKKNFAGARHRDLSPPVLPLRRSIRQQPSQSKTSS